MMACATCDGLDEFDGFDGLDKFDGFDKFDMIFGWISTSTGGM